MINMNQDKTFLGTEPVGKLLLKLSVPTVIAQLVNMLYNIVDRIYIGHMPGDGSLALTGVGVCLPIIMIVSAFAALISTGGAPRASIFMGKNDHESAEKTLGSCFTLQILVSLILTAVLLIWNRPLLLAFGASENTIDYAVSYMNIYAIGTIFVQLTLRHERLHYRAGLCKNRHADRSDRRGVQYRLRPAVHLRIPHGRQGRRSGDHSFTGRVVRLGLHIPAREKRRCCGSKMRISACTRNIFFPVWRWARRLLSCRQARASFPSASTLPCSNTAATSRSAQ